jgi:phosphoglycerate dehydrogenase-like enzyme
MNNALRIWTNTEYPNEATELLKDGVAGHELVFAKDRVHILAMGGPSEELLTAQVAFGQPDPAQIIANSDLKFVQITSAGYTRYDTEEFRSAMASRGGVFCNSSSVYAEPCAQHILAFMLASARQIPASVKAQVTDQAWVFPALRPICRILRGERVLIVGYGAIGKRLVELLVPFWVDTVAIRRTVRGNEPVPTYSDDHLDEWLGQADHVVNILPANASNAKLFDASKFNLMKWGAQFYNIGRGTTVDQVALIEALNSGQVGSALLDVTDPEPLPSDHPLWTAPNCTITPHIGGGYEGEETVAVKHFLSNLKRFEVGEPLVDRVF